MTTIMGINAHHADSAACLVQEGELVAAAEEERFRRIKHWAGLPSEAVRYCLAEPRISLPEVDHVAINRNPKVNLFKKALYPVSKRPSFEPDRARLERPTITTSRRQMATIEHSDGNRALVGAVG